MIWIDLIIAFITALIVAGLLAGALGWRHPGQPRGGCGPAMLFLLILLFFLGWAGGVWLTPFGPAVAGSYFLPIVLVILLLALMIAALGPHRTPVTRSDAHGTSEEEYAGRLFYSPWFWVLVVAAFALVIARYAWFAD
jgi:hypothetical protein